MSAASSKSSFTRSGSPCVRSSTSSVSSEASLSSRVEAALRSASAIESRQSGIAKDAAYVASLSRAADKSAFVTAASADLQQKAVRPLGTRALGTENPNVQSLSVSQHYRPFATAWGGLVTRAEAGLSPSAVLKSAFQTSERAVDSIGGETRSADDYFRREPPPPNEQRPVESGARGPLSDRYTNEQRLRTAEALLASILSEPPAMDATAVDPNTTIFAADAGRLAAWSGKAAARQAADVVRASHCPGCGSSLGVRSLNLEDVRNGLPPSDTLCRVCASRPLPSGRAASMGVGAASAHFHRPPLFPSAELPAPLCPSPVVLLTGPWDSEARRLRPVVSLK